MSRSASLSLDELRQLDRVYREGGLRAMASPHVHYDEAQCPHPGCDHAMEWIDFKLEPHGDRAKVYEPLVRAWWEGPGFVGQCPRCGRWIRLTTLGIVAVADEDVERFRSLPDNWSSVAQFA